MPSYAETITTTYAIYQAVKWSIIIWCSFAICVGIFSLFCKIKEKIKWRKQR